MAEAPGATAPSHSTIRSHAAPWFALPWYGPSVLWLTIYEPHIIELEQPPRDQQLEAGHA